MGSAGTAVVLDGASLFFNPGGVSFLKENSINVGASATLGNTCFLDANTNKLSRTKSPVGTPFTVYAVFGKDSSRLKFGLAVYTPFGSTVKWEDKWSGRFALTSLKLFAVFIQPTVSYKINDELGIGGGFVYSTGNMDMQKDLPLTDINGNFGKAELKGKATGYGFNIGILNQATEKLSFALT